MGKPLLAACISKAESKGITRVELEARADNYRAIRLVEQLGFVHETLKKCTMRFNGVYHHAAQVSLLLLPIGPEVNIRALERLRVQSLLQRDMPTAWRLHSPDYPLITPSGRSLSRERYLGMIEAGSLVYPQWQAEAIQVRLRGNMAVVRYPATLQLESSSASGAGTPTLTSRRLASGWQSGRRPPPSGRIDGGPVGGLPG